MELIDEVQWVLRNARLHASDPALRTAAGFAQGGGRAEAVHRAQVGRWERGGVEVTRALVRRYETVLALPEGRLLSAIDLFSRSRDPIRPAATLPAREAPDVDATLELLERALSDDRMSGVDWDHLSDAIGRMPHVLVRPADWEALFVRLLEESSLSLHLDYAQRTEALARLAGHPRSGSVVASLARQVVARPDAQFYNDTLSMLQFTDHPDVLTVILDQLREPTNTSSLRACLIVLTTLVRSRAVPRHVRDEIAHLAVRHLRDPEHPYRVHRGAANLVRAVGLGSLRLATVLTAEDRLAVASIVRDGRAVSVQAVRDAQRRIRAALEEGEAHEAAAEPVLSQLVERALGVTDEEDRSNALAILMLSPQAGIVGQVHARLFAEAWQRDDHVGAQESLTVLSFVSQEADLDLFERVALGRGTPPEIAMNAGYVVGNTLERRTRRRDERERAFARRVVEVVRAGSGEAAVDDQVRGLVYVLGMRGRRDLLAQVAEALGPRCAAPARPGGPLDVAAVARGIVAYWLGLPEHLRPAW